MRGGPAIQPIDLDLHQHGIRLTGRWVGLSYDGPVITGWGTIARTEREAINLMNSLRQEGAVTQ